MNWKRQLLALTLVGGAVVTAPAAALTWTSVASGHEGHGHGGHNHGPQHRLVDAEEANVELWLPTLEKRPVEIGEGGKANLRPTGMDYYHALVARRGNETAVRYLAMRGRASGESPSKLIGATKADLEIVPEPYPREHQRYYGGRSAAFRVTYRGEPVAGQTVALETQKGMRLFANTDASGRIAFELPPEVGKVEPGRRTNPPTEFVVSTARGEHRFALTSEYHVNPRHWQSGQAGAWSGLAGFVAGLALLGWTRRARSGGKG